MYPGRLSGRNIGDGQHPQRYGPPSQRGKHSVEQSILAPQMIHNQQEPQRG